MYKKILTEIAGKLNREPFGMLIDQEINTYAVLLPLITIEEKLCLLFEVRSRHLKDQPGEICFPGGRIEEQDPCPEATAIRETAEEIGITANNIELLGPLDVLWTPFQYRIYPFVANITEGCIPAPVLAEVEKLFYVPLEFLSESTPYMSTIRVNMAPEESFPYHLIPGGSNYPWLAGEYPVYFYEYQDYVIWGITARILHHFLKKIK